MPKSILRSELVLPVSYTHLSEGKQDGVVVSQLFEIRLAHRRARVGSCFYLIALVAQDLAVEADYARFHFVRMRFA